MCEFAGDIDRLPTVTLLGCGKPTIRVPRVYRIDSQTAQFVLDSSHGNIDLDLSTEAFDSIKVWDVNGYNVLQIHPAECGRWFAPHGSDMTHLHMPQKQAVNAGP